MSRAIRRERESVLFAIYLFGGMDLVIDMKRSQGSYIDDIVSGHH